MCPDGCSGHGQCHTDVTSGDSTCTCDIKWEGTGCGEPGCPTNDELKKCSGHGSCITEGKPHEYDRTWKCACSSGFTGEDCSQPSCPNDCSKRGECRDGVASVPLALLETVAKSGRYADPVASASGRSMGTVTMTKWNACAKKATRASTACTKLTMVAAEFHCWRLVTNPNKLIAVKIVRRKLV